MSLLLLYRPSSGHLGGAAPEAPDYSRVYIPAWELPKKPPKKPVKRPKKKVEEKPQEEAVSAPVEAVLEAEATDATEPASIFYELLNENGFSLPITFELPPVSIVVNISQITIIGNDDEDVMLMLMALL